MDFGNEQLDLTELVKGDDFVSMYTFYEIASQMLKMDQDTIRKRVGKIMDSIFNGGRVNFQDEHGHYGWHSAEIPILLWLVDSADEPCMKARKWTRTGGRGELLYRSASKVMQKARELISLIPEQVARDSWLKLADNLCQWSLHEVTDHIAFTIKQVLDPLVEVRDFDTKVDYLRKFDEHIGAFLRQNPIPSDN